MTRRYLELLACERFGIDPRTWAAVHEELAAELVAFATVRREEEARMAGLDAVRGKRK